MTKSLPEILYKILLKAEKNKELGEQNLFTQITPQVIDEATQAIQSLIEAECLAARIDELEYILRQAREHTITDIEMIMHHTKGKVDFIEAVETHFITNELVSLKELSKEGVDG